MHSIPVFRCDFHGLRCVFHVCLFFLRFSRFAVQFFAGFFFYGLVYCAFGAPLCYMAFTVHSACDAGFSVWFSRFAAHIIFTVFLPRLSRFARAWRPVDGPGVSPDDHNHRPVLCSRFFLFFFKKIRGEKRALYWSVSVIRMPISSTYVFTSIYGRRFFSLFFGGFRCRPVFISIA